MKTLTNAIEAIASNISRHAAVYTYPLFRPRPSAWPREPPSYDP
jgi:hypothetical protein